MVTHIRVEATCSVCGTTSEQVELGSVYIRGYQDLDLRPAEMQRGTMDTWMQRCPECGYVAHDLGTDEGFKRQDIRVAQEATLAFEGGVNAQARSFLVASFLAESKGHWSTAGFRSLWAAWEADDVPDARCADLCRRRAADLLTKELANSDWTSEETQTMALRLLDVSRRMSNGAEVFWNVAGQLQPFLTQTANEALPEIFSYQVARMNAADRGCYTLGQAFGEEEASQ